MSCLHFKCLLELERETACRPIGRGLCQFCTLTVSVSLGEEACGNGAAAHSVPCVHWTDEKAQLSSPSDLPRPESGLPHYTAPRLLPAGGRAFPEELDVGSCEQDFPDLPRLLYFNNKTTSTRMISPFPRPLFLFSIHVHPLLDPKHILSSMFRAVHVYLSLSETLARPQHALCSHPHLKFSFSLTDIRT